MIKPISLQGYIAKEIDVDSRWLCFGNCAYYKYTRSRSCSKPNSQNCGKHRRCRGTVHDCRFYDADAWVCLSRKPYRRYESIRYENRLILGPHGQCDSSEMKVDSWWRFLFHCSYCLCLCDDDTSPSTDRYVSLMPAVSDTRNNMVGVAEIR